MTQKRTRTVAFNVRLTREEFDGIKASAKARQMTVSHYARYSMGVFGLPTPRKLTALELRHEEEQAADEAKFRRMQDRAEAYLEDDLEQARRLIAKHDAKNKPDDDDWVYLDDAQRILALQKKMMMEKGFDTGSSKNTVKEG